MASAQAQAVLVEVANLQKYYPIEKGLLKRVVGHVKAVDDVSFTIRRNETLGLVGESGSGKTTLGHCLLRAIEPTGGKILFHPQDSAPLDVLALDKQGLRTMRRKAQLVFQNPYSSLDPRKTILQIVSEPLILHRIAKGNELVERVKALLTNVIKHVSNRVAVMYVGKLVELADVVDLFATPRHPYTEALLSAIPNPNPDVRMQRIILPGEVANPSSPPSGCYFHPRCRYAKTICQQQAPSWTEAAPGHFVACHRAHEIELVGAPLLD